ncbi:MAG: hypothetical protein M1115_10855 [Actinobacteria bacterium]|nr:hypothetical protein [Actinomycetota bacterium]
MSTAKPSRRVTAKGGVSRAGAKAKISGRADLGHVQVGKRPSSPAFLAVLGVVWIAVGLVAAFGLHASWRLVPTVVAIGIGLFFLRGASATVLRRGSRR